MSLPVGVWNWLDQTGKALTQIESHLGSIDVTLDRIAKALEAKNQYDQERKADEPVARTGRRTGRKGS
jgi:hypothetical protein